jgi:2-oxoisovalerate dehydrogenase E1 component beta subunit
MSELTLLEAINLTLAREMARDESVVVLGEEVGQLGGIFGATEALHSQFGDRRVIDTAASEGGVVGLAVGMAMYGLRPVAEIQFADFMWSGLEQLLGEAAKLRYRSGGQYACPLVLRVPYGGGTRGGIYQSASPEAHFCHAPGLSVLAPADAADAAGLLRQALRGSDPVVFLEPKNLYRAGRAVVDEEAIPVGKARLRRSGTDVSVITYGSMVPAVAAAAEAAGERGIEAEVLDLRSLVPMDIAAVLETVAKTGRVVLVNEAPRGGGYMAEVAATISERALLHLEAPIERVTGLDTPVPYVHEAAYLPDAESILAAVERVANF